jgi:hypothetical protein
MVFNVWRRLNTDRCNLNEAKHEDICGSFKRFGDAILMMLCRNVDVDNYTNRRRFPKYTNMQNTETKTASGYLRPGGRKARIWEPTSQARLSTFGREAEVERLACEVDEEPDIFTFLAMAENFKAWNVSSNAEAHWLTFTIIDTLPWPQKKTWNNRVNLLSRNGTFFGLLLQKRR